MIRRTMIAGSTFMALVIALLGVFSLFAPITFWKKGTAPSNVKETGQLLKELGADTVDRPPAMRIWLDRGDLRLVHVPTVKYHVSTTPPKDSKSRINAFAFESSTLTVNFLTNARPYPGGPAARIPFTYGETRLTIPLWGPFILAAAYPTIFLVKNVYRRRHRRKKGLCLKCGYDLTGNVSGICSECGEKI